MYLPGLPCPVLPAHTQVLAFPASSLHYFRNIPFRSHCLQGLPSELTSPPGSSQSSGRSPADSLQLTPNDRNMPAWLQVL